MSFDEGLGAIRNYLLGNQRKQSFANKENFKKATPLNRFNEAVNNSREVRKQDGYVSSEQIKGLHEAKQGFRSPSEKVNTDTFITQARTKRGHLATKNALKAASSPTRSVHDLEIDFADPNMISLADNESSEAAFKKALKASLRPDSSQVA